MNLSIDFRCPIFNERAVINKGVHVVIDDGCRFAITELEGLTELQQVNVDGEKNSMKRTHLLHMNKSLLDFLLESGDKLELNCPSCKKHYMISKEIYQRAYERFLAEPLKFNGRLDIISY